MSAVRAIAVVLTVTSAACTQAETAEESAAAEQPAGGMASIQDDTSQPDIVKVAVGSPDHTTLVTALQTAEYVNVLANPGPFTVFAPTNAAFEKLPAGTVEELLKPENRSQLRKILQHHVTTSALGVEMFQDGQSLGMVDLGYETITFRDGDMYIGEAKVIGSVRASNGWVHVIDAVLVPAEG